MLVSWSLITLTSSLNFSNFSKIGTTIFNSTVIFIIFPTELKIVDVSDSTVKIDPKPTIFFRASIPVSNTTPTCPTKFPKPPRTPANPTLFLRDTDSFNTSLEEVATIFFKIPNLLKDSKLSNPCK